MTCEQAAAADLAFRYVANQLDQEERNAFESHYFECAPCFDQVQLNLSMQASLMRGPRLMPVRHQRTWFAWTAIAATVVIMASIGFWRLRIPSRAPQRPQASVATAPQPDALALLARIELPVYQTPALRGAAPEGHFREGMERYRGANYAGAIDELSQADPRSPDVQFFLGVSYLMQDQADAAISHLRATLQLGESLDIEPAHFFLAKAFLRRKDTASASKELDAAIALHGDYENKARDLAVKLAK